MGSSAPHAAWCSVNVTAPNPGGKLSLTIDDVVTGLTIKVTALDSLDSCSLFSHQKTQTPISGIFFSSASGNWPNHGASSRDAFLLFLTEPFNVDLIIPLPSYVSFITSIQDALFTVIFVTSRRTVHVLEILITFSLHQLNITT